MDLNQCNRTLKYDIKANSAKYIGKKVKRLEVTKVNSREDKGLGSEYKITGARKTGKKGAQIPWKREAQF